MKKRALLSFSIAICGMLLGGGASAEVAQFADIKIEGSRPFVKQVTLALKLLQRRSPDGFFVVRRYVGCIRESRRSGMRAYGDPPTFDLSMRTANQSLTWCAACIAHDAYHSKLYHDYRNEHGEPVPDAAWSGQARELQCNVFQFVVMHDLGSPAAEIEYVANQDGKHFDLDGDGRATWIDHLLQDW